MVLHFYSRSIKQVKYIVEKKESQPKILTKSEWKRIPPIRHPIPTLPNNSNNKFLLNTDQLITDVENSRNRRTIINPPSLSNDQIKEKVKNQWYVYTKISEWVDYIYNSGFVKGISEKGVIQYFKDLIKNSLPDNILFKCIRFFGNFLYENCLKKSMNWSKEKGKEIFNYVSNVCHNGWNISKECCNKLKTFITGSEKKEENNSMWSKIVRFFSSIKDKLSNIFFWKNKNVGKNQSNVIVEGNKINNNVVIEGNKIDNNVIVEGNKIDNNVIVESNNNQSNVIVEINNQKSFFSRVYSSIINTPIITLYNKIFGKKDIPEIEGNKIVNQIEDDTNINNIVEGNKINNQIEDDTNMNNIVEGNKINNQIEDYNKLNNQIEDNNSGWYFRFGLDRAYNFVKNSIENIKNIFISKKEENISDINNNQNITENTPIIEEVESITEEPIRSKENLPSDLINKSTNKMEEVESKEEWYDPIEDSEEKWHDPIENSEENWQDFQEEL